jgi:hypothetical protein
LLISFDLLNGFEIFLSMLCHDLLLVVRSD